MSGALRLTFCVLRQAKTQTIDVNRLLTLPKVLPTVSIIQTKNSSFFNQGDANQVWGSLTGLSNTGKKRGRGRGIRKKINLNKGQEIGQGRAGMEWPGLTSSVYSGQEIVKMHKHGPRQEYFDNILQQKSAKTSFRSLKIPPILRGWTGSTMAGRSTDPPDPVGDYAFDGFEAKILEVKKVVNVSGTVKSVPRFSCMVVVGNKNGIGGFAVGKATKMFTALRKATNKAAQHLQYVPRFEKHTIYHNMYSEQTATRMFLYRKHEGYGVVAHRCIKSICDVIGVKNLYVKCEGSTKNVQNVTKAFFNALRNQETHQELADRLKLHVVEQRGENDFMPVVVASPSDGAVSKTPLPIEESNFETLYFDGKLQVMKRKRPFYIFHKTHKRALKARTMLKIQKAARRERILYDLEPPKIRRAKKTGD